MTGPGTSGLHPQPLTAFKQVFSGKRLEAEFPPHHSQSTFRKTSPTQGASAQGGVPAKPHLPHWGEGPASLREAGRWLLWRGAQGRVGRPSGRRGEFLGPQGYGRRVEACSALQGGSGPLYFFGCEGGLGTGPEWLALESMLRVYSTWVSFSVIKLFYLS